MFAKRAIIKPRVPNPKTIIRPYALNPKEKTAGNFPVLDFPFGQKIVPPHISLAVNSAQDDRSDFRDRSDVEDEF